MYEAMYPEKGNIPEYNIINQLLKEEKINVSQAEKLYQFTHPKNVKRVISESCFCRCFNNLMNCFLGKNNYAWYNMPNNNCLPIYCDNNVEVK
jgi:hypothetical protein